MPRWRCKLAVLSGGLLGRRLAGSGQCTTKSAYQSFKPAVSDISNAYNATFTAQVKQILDSTWKNRNLPPRVQTFAWRLLRNAIPSGARASQRSSHISSSCARCGQKENDIHLFFSRHFVRLVWFASQLGLRVDNLITQGMNQVSQVLHFILQEYKDDDAVANVFLLLWEIWKARNDLLFNEKLRKPLQIIHAAKALFYEDQGLDNKDKSCLQKRRERHNILSSDFCRERIREGPNVFTDAAWRNVGNQANNFSGVQLKVGLGIFISIPREEMRRTIFVSAVSKASSALQAEAKALQLAGQIRRRLNLQNINFAVDNQIVDDAAARRNTAQYPGHWSIKGEIQSFIQDTSTDRDRIFKI